MGDYRVEGVPRAALPLVWPVVEPMLRPALERDETPFHMGHVFDDIDTERCMLWTVLDGADIVAALVVRLKGPALQVWLMGGRDFDEWHHTVEPLLARYASEHGAGSVQAMVRPGLGRKLTGWRKRCELVELRAES